MSVVQNDPAFRQPKRIAFFGLFGVGSIGNESSLRAMLHAVRQRFPAAELSCICADPARVAAQHQIATVPIDIDPDSASHRPGGRIGRLLWRIPTEIGLWGNALRYLRGVDLLLIPGTGILDDFGVGPFQLPYDLFKWCLAAKLTRTPLVFVSIGAGPIHHPLSRWLMKTALRLADYHSYRDALSLKYMQSIGFDVSRGRVYPDLVFSLPTPAPLHANGVQKRPSVYMGEEVKPLALSERIPGISPGALYAPRPKVVGLGLMAYYGWHNRAEAGEAIYQAYLTKLTAFTTWLLDQHYSIQCLIGETTDRRAVQDLLARVKTQRPHLDSQRICAAPIHSVDDLLYQLRATDVVVATRFHNVLCALMMHKPVLSIGYARKNDVLMAEMGLADYCQQIEELDVDRLIAQFSALVCDYQPYVRVIAQKNQLYRQQLDEQYATILQPT